MTLFKTGFSFLQKIGKTTMLPVSVLPIAGLLLGIGSAHFSFLPATFSNLMAQGGGSIFSALPLLFAIAMAIGLTGNDGVAAVAATVGFMTMIATMGVMGPLIGAETKEVFGIKTIDTGVFGGILIGGVAAAAFNRYYRIQLPQFLGFFAGKRFVPIVTSLAAIFVGVLLSFAWQPIGHGISLLSHAAAYGNPTMAAALYGFVERLLLPFGLHHIWNVPFFFEIGSYTEASGKVVHGDITRFFAGDPTAGILGGAYLFKMWGLPAAAIAMWRNAKPENRVRVGSFMVSAALTSFLTGITEPLEFSFLFVAPFLYFLHACLAACAQALFGLLSVKVGFTFSQGFIDYVLYFNMGTKPWMVLVIGPFWAALYYGLFTFFIRAFNLRTPGREDESEATAVSDGLPTTGSSKALELVQAFGGRSNIVNLDACITRLRVDLKDVALASPDRLKALGASGVMAVGTGLQVVFGPSSENLKTDMEAAIAANMPGIDQAFAGKSQLAAPKLDLAPAAPAPSSQLALWLPCLGGQENLISSEDCAGNRLRVQLKDPARLNEKQLREKGVAAVMRLPNNLFHLVVVS